MLAVWSPKGGSGASVVAAALSLTMARRGGCRLVDLSGDQPALLGLASDPGVGVGDWLAVAIESGDDALHRLAVEVAPRLALIPRGASIPTAAPGAGGRLAAALQDGPPTVADLGTADALATVELGQAAGALVAVLRPCYLALRRAVVHPLLDATAGVVIVDEPGRSLGPADVSRVLERPVAAVVRAEARVARAVDAGLLAARVPDSLSRMASRVWATLEPSARGEAA